jgi:hypothetical protein
MRASFCPDQPSPQCGARTALTLEGENGRLKKLLAKAMLDNVLAEVMFIVFG